MTLLATLMAAFTLFIVHRTFGVSANRKLPFVLFICD